ncbi:hypothetical protein ACFLRR_00475 [Bacteroidota bacterium]
MDKLYKNNIKSRLYIFTLIILFCISYKSNAFQQKIDRSRTVRSISNSDNENGKNVRYINTNDQFPLIEFSGDFIAFSDDEKSIKNMSPGASLIIVKRDFGLKRTISVNASMQGDLKYKYFVGKKEIPFKPEGEKLLREILIDVIRCTNLGAEQRVNKIFTEKGLKGFLVELDKIESNYTKQEYYSYLLNNDKLSRDDFKVIISSIKEHIDSDYELGQVLSSIPKEYIFDKEIAPEYFKAFKNISADYEISSILDNIIRIQELNENNVKVVLDATHHLDSDYERVRVLNSMIDNYDIKDSILVHVLDNAKHISISSEYKDVLNNIIINSKLNNKELVSVIHAGENIGIAYDLSDLLNNVVVHYDISGEVLEEFIKTAEKMNSDNDYTRVLTSVINNEKLNSNGIINLIKASFNIESDFERSEFLMKMIQVHGVSDENLKYYIKSADLIHSEVDYIRVIVELMRNIELNDKNIINIIEAGEKIYSDVELMHFLMEICSNYKPEGPSLEAFLEQAERLSPGYDMARVISFLVDGNVELNKGNTIQILHACENIQSNTDLRNLLLVIGNRMPENDKELINLVIKVAENLQSVDYYDQVLKSLKK